MTILLANFDRETGFELIDAIRKVNQDSRKVSAAEQEFLRKGLAAWTNEKTSRDAEAILVEYWNNSIAEDDDGPARTEAQIRVAFHRASESIHEATNGRAVIVQDDRLALAKTRKRATPFEKAVKTVKKDKTLTDEQTKAIAKALLEAYKMVKGA